MFTYKRQLLIIVLILAGGTGGLAVGRWISRILTSEPTPTVATDSISVVPIEPTFERGRGGDSPEKPITNPATPKSNSGRRALLVGVTTYDHLPQSKHLQGPSNDVVLLRDVLISRFGFRTEDIVILSETAKRDSLRPTKANIEREFKALAEAAREGDQVVVLLAGHGDKQPESNPPDPDYPEPDGLDEIFLPADVRLWANGKERVPQAITDNEIGQWLKAITDKKAYVWAMFDCCHSGNITRGLEVSRELEPGFLVPQSEIDVAQKAATSRATKPTPEMASTGMRLDAKNPYLVALFACRSTETTPELLSPKPRGLLTSSVCEVLTQTTEPITYRELVQRVLVRYARRPQGAPTPTVEGIGQEREILGVKQWPSRSSVVLSRSEDQYKLNVGILHGVTVGTIYVANGPSGTPDARKQLGHVKVVEVQQAESIVELCPFDKTPAPASLPDLCSCQTVFVDYGARRFKVGVDLPTGPARDRVLSVLKDMADPRTGSIEIVNNLASAEWIILRDSKGYSLCDDSRSRYRFAMLEPTHENFREELHSKFERIYRARNLLTVAAQSSSEIERGGASVKVVIEVLRHPSRTAPTVPVVAENGMITLRAGEMISYRITNKSDFNVDVSLLIINPNLAITPFFPLDQNAGKQTLAPGAQFQTAAGHVRAPFGQEQMVAIAVRTGKTPADFTCLAQEGLEQRRGGTNAATSLETSAGRMLEAAMYRVGGTRGVTPIEAKEMAMQIIPWVAVPTKK